jgi:hypothetical protein
MFTRSLGCRAGAGFRSYSLSMPLKAKIINPTMVGKAQVCSGISLGLLFLLEMLIDGCR